MILGKKYGNTRSIKSEDLFFFRDHHDFIFLEEQETGAHFRKISIQLWFKVSVYVF